MIFPDNLIEECFFTKHLFDGDSLKKVPLLGCLKNTSLSNSQDNLLKKVVPKSFSIKLSWKVDEAIQKGFSKKAKTF